MDAFNPTTKTQQAVLSAVQAATLAGNTDVSPVHLLGALLIQRDSIAVPLLSAVGADRAAVHSDLNRLANGLPSGAGATVSDPNFNRDAVRVLSTSQQLATEMGDEYVSTEHLLVGLATAGGGVADLLRRHAATPDALRDAFVRVRGLAPVTSLDPECTYKALERYGVDLTERARKGELDPVIGRNAEIRRMVQVLARRTKNNPVLIGEAGVGKTAIVEGLAQRIAAGDVPESLRGKRIVAMDLGAMAGIVLREVAESAGQVIAFLDDLHTIGGAGATGESAIMIRRMLARGELRMIGAITPDKYREWIDTDPALERWVHQVSIGEPNVEDTISILRVLKLDYEMHHCVSITDGALVAAATLSDRYITARFLPDKAIDLVDEAACRLRMEIESRPGEIDDAERVLRRLEIEEMTLSREDDPDSTDRLAVLRTELAEKREQVYALTARWQIELDSITRVRDLKKQIEQIRAESERAERGGDLGRAAELLYGRIPALQMELDAATVTANEQSNVLLKEKVTANDVADVVSERTGIPAGQLLEDETRKAPQAEDASS